MLDQKTIKHFVLDHLDGKDPSLGIIPIMDDGNCRWGCIDIDDYKLDHKKLLKQIKQLELPLISCRSKSGGAHVFLFIDGVVPAKAIRKKLNNKKFTDNAPKSVIEKEIKKQSDAIKKIKILKKNITSR